MLRLAIVCAGKTTHLAVPEGVSTLGAGRDNQLVVTCPGVSRSHAEVVRTDRSVILRDLGSKNGLVVSGERHAEVRLTPETAVAIGRAVVRLEEVDTGDATVALATGDRQPEAGMPEPLTTEPLFVGDDVPLALLEWIRKTEQGLWSTSAAFEEARRVLGATTLILHDEEAIQKMAGPLPPAEALLARETGKAPEWLIAPGETVPQVSAYYAAPQPRALWHCEFLGFLRDKLGGTPIAERSSRRGELVFSEGFVRGSSPVMAPVYEAVRQAVESDLNVILLGESGTGKEVIAQIIHDSDPTRRGAFVAVNMAAIPAEMLEAELFGVESRAATNVDARPGYFRRADRGTILLDEIGDMPLALQAKVLRTVEDHIVVPLGASRNYPVDVRVIAATNHVDLAERVEEGKFRRDLFHRLNALPITVPPLRARPDDLPAFVIQFVQGAAARFRKQIRGVTPKALSVLRDHPWPGNLRELRQIIEAAVLACPNGAALESSHIRPLAVLPDASLGGSLRQQIEGAERRAIADALATTGGNKSRAADILGISRAALHKKLRLFGMK